MVNSITMIRSSWVKMDGFAASHTMPHFIYAPASTQAGYG
jgi:hypothetical protein